MEIVKPIRPNIFGSFVFFLSLKKKEKRQNEKNSKFGRCTVTQYD